MTCAGHARHLVAMVVVAMALAACGSERNSSSGQAGISPRSTATTTAAGATSTTTSPPASTGTLIDLDLIDVPIVDALNEIAHKARVSLSVSSDVTGTVTLAVRAMPWDRALALIAKQHDLRVDHTNVMLVVSKRATPATDTFTGAPIVVSFESTPIREVASVLATHAKVAIRVDDNVEVAVTQRLRNVPWDFVLDHIARKYDLRIIRDGDAIRIAR
jgi:type II secretory pathway component HofQ